MKVLLAGVAAAGLLAAGAQADWNEVGDAGDWVGTAQDTGVGALNFITGSTNGTDDWVDAYRIQIVDVAAFYATTAPTYGGNGSADFTDTRLWLIDQAGTVVFANDDAAGQASLLSYISDPSTYAANTGGVLNNNPGSVIAGNIYTLIISGFSNDPEDANFVDLVALASDFDALQGPDPGSTGVFDHWENLGDSGEYSIALGGAMGVPAPGVLALLGLAGLAGTRRRRG